MDDMTKRAVIDCVLHETRSERIKVAAFWRDCGNDMSKSESEQLDAEMDNLRKACYISASLALLSVEEAIERADGIRAMSIAESFNSDDGEEEEEEDA